jgi:hypothetical protein
MEILTILLGCVIHITLILLFECIFLLGILYPILHKLANRMSQNLNQTIFRYIISALFPESYITTTGEVDPKTGTKTFTFKEPIVSLFRACAIDEIKYLKIQENMPYIVSGILVFVLFVCGIIIIIIKKATNMIIDYKFVIITSTISFMLICWIAFMILWFILAKQPYVLNYEADIYSAALDVYNNT